MPSKRQSSKQRRATQNRQTRAQLAARREHAGQLSASAAAARPDDPAPSGGSGGSGGRSGGLLGGLFGGGGGGLFGGGGGSRGAAARPVRPEPQQAEGIIASRPDGTPLPGARAAFVAVILAAMGFVFMLAVPSISVDDRSEVLPPSFPGLYLEARSDLTGSTVEADTVTFIEAYGPSAVAFTAVPLLMVALAWWMHRRTSQSRPLTFGMVALAAAVFILQGLGPYFIPALIALAVASFQARKAELPARMAEKSAARSRDDGVIDVDSVEEIDDDEDEYDDEGEEDLDEEYEVDEDEDDEDLDEPVEDDDQSTRRRKRRW